MVRCRKQARSRLIPIRPPVLPVYWRMRTHSSTSLQPLCGYLAETCMVQRFSLEAVSLQQLEPKLQENSEARELVGRALNVLSQNVAQLMSLLETIHDSEHELKAASVRLSGMFVGSVCKRRSRDAPAMLRDDYALINLAAMNYIMLHTKGLATRHSSVASLALGHLQHLAAISQDIVRLMPSVVIHELKGVIDSLPTEAERTAYSNTQSAWRNSASAA